MPSGSSVMQHAASCPQCAQLLSSSGALGRRLSLAVASSASLRGPDATASDALLAHEHGWRAFLRSRPTRLRWSLSMALAALLLAGELLRQRVPWRELAARSLAGLGLVAALAWVGARALATPPLERRAARFHWLLVVLAWALPCALMWIVPRSMASGAESAQHFVARSLACFGYGSVLAAPCFALLWALDRGPRLSYRVAALAAAEVAALANLILLVHCPNTQRAHLTAGHFSIGLAWISSAVIAGWWRDRARALRRSR